MDNIDLKEQLSEELQSNEGLSKFGDANALAKSYLKVESKATSDRKEYETNLAKATEGFIKLPGEDADDDTKRTFHIKLGCPEKAENYSDIEIDGVPKVFGDDDKTLTVVRNACHKAGVSDEHYKAVMTQIVKEQLVSLDAFVKRDEQTEKEAVASLTREWGGDAKYKENSELARRLVKHYEPEDTAISEFLKDTRLGSYAPLVKLLGNIAIDIMSEETTFTGKTVDKKNEAEVELSPVTGEPLLKYDKSPELK